MFSAAINLHKQERIFILNLRQVYTFFFFFFLLLITQNLKNTTKSLILPLESIEIRPQKKMRKLEIIEQSVSFVIKSSQLELTIAIYEPWV